MAREDHDFADNLVQSLIALPLLQEMTRRREEGSEEPIDIIIDLNLFYSGGQDPRAIEAARERTMELVNEVCENDPELGVDRSKSFYGYQHVFARLQVPQIESLAKRVETLHLDTVPSERPVYKIWLDAEIERQLFKSVQTIKADASLVSYGASGRDVVWAVMDSGIDRQHPHFRMHGNLDVSAPMKHKDFTGEFGRAVDENPNDNNGHGTHVAGIIAGEYNAAWVDPATGKPLGEATVVARRRNEEDRKDSKPFPISALRGVAPQCKLLDLRVLDADGRGKESNILAALGYVQQLNASSRWPLVHGVNLSVGYEFNAEWFACGQSPLCAEVDRIVRAGTPVVTAAGNKGYGRIRMLDGSGYRTGLSLSINDPGNAALAITVGATHREHPHTYGVSYFSSKGPTGDGRLKPDLVAPGERVISCAAGREGERAAEAAGIGVCHYREESGTSMAAPHVSGAIAAFLSIRREFIGQPERVKEIFLSTCTDLGRERYFQGHGLLDLMRAIQSV